MNNWITFGTLVLCCWSVFAAKAQSPVYFFYDPACMQQLRYEKTGTMDELAHTDYYMNMADDKQVILRVQNDPGNLNRTLVSELPIKPVLCGERNYLTPAAMKDINNNRRLAYVVVQMGQQYAVYNVHSAATLEANAKGLVYTDPIYGFQYTYANSSTSEVLNKANNKERNVFFEAQRNTACLPTYDFKVISRHIETPIKRLSFVNTIGLARVESAKGSLRLASINGVPFAQVLAQRCSTSVNAVLPPQDAAVAPPSKVLADTVGMTPGEKRVWLLRQRNREIPTAVVQQPAYPNNPLPPNAGPSYGNPSPPTTLRPPTPQLLKGGIYIVQEKDNLYSISERFGVSIDRLIEINGLQTYELGLNQPLKVVDDGTVPHRDRNPQIVVDEAARTKTTIHLVEQGDTLYAISKRYGITLKDVYNLNPSLTSEFIDINQPIVVGFQPL